MALFDEHLDWLVTLWRKAAWREYALERASQMEREAPELFSGMRPALERAAETIQVRQSARRAQQPPQPPQQQS